MTLAVLFVVVLLVSAVAARIISKGKGYDHDLFTLGGLLGGPWAVGAALGAERYSVEVDEEELAAAADMPAPALDAPEQQAPEMAPPALPEQEAPRLAAPPIPEAVPSPQESQLASPEFQGLQAPALPQDAPQIQERDPNAPLPSIPEASQGAAPEIKSLTPLADRAPMIPHDVLAPGIPQDLAPPVLPKEIPTPRPIVEPQDDEHKDPSVPAVANEKPQEPQVAPAPRSLVDLVGAEAPTQLRRGVEFYESGGEDEEGVEAAPGLLLGKPDENGIPTEAVAPGEATCGMCPHCGHDSYADWYGLCIECMQPFPVKVAWFDPTAPVVLDVLEEAPEGEEGVPTTGKKKIGLPGLKR